MVIGLKNILILLLLVSAAGLHAQDISVSATVNKNRVALNENFEYTITVSGGSSNLPNPVFPDLSAFSIISGPNTSTSIQYVNGKSSASKSFSFYLIPRKTGKFTIGPALVTTDSGELKSNVITITVSKGTPKKPQPRQKIPNSKDRDLLGENLYLKTIVDKTNVFQNEQILVEYKLYFRVSVRNYNFEKIPSNPGFWMEEFDLPRQPRIQNEVINGITYQVATLRKIALFPTKPGELTIEPLSVAVEAVLKRRSSRRSIFDSFFDDPFGRTVQKVLNTKPVKIRVKPFPAAGRPASFGGAVGKYRLKVNIDKEQVKANDAVSVKLTLNGTGNIKLLKPPKLKTPVDMEVYDPKEKTKIKRENNIIAGTKTVEYILVPRMEGEYLIEPVRFAYFDPQTKKYRTLVSKALKITVSPGVVVPGGMVSGSGLSKQEVALLGEDIRYIKETAEYYTSGALLYHNVWYFIAYLLPLFGIAFALWYSKQNERLRSDVGLARRRKAGKIAAKHLAASKGFLKSGRHHEFYKQMSQALQGFVSDKLNIQMTDFNSLTVQRSLERAGVDPKEIREYIDCLSESDFKQFGGEKADLDEMRAFYEKAKGVLTQLEKYI